MRAGLVPVKGDGYADGSVVGVYYAVCADADADNLELSGAQGLDNTFAAIMSALGAQA